jgi:hypothetical protein
VPDVREDRDLAGLRAGFLQFVDSVFANEPLSRALSLGVAEDPALLALAAPAKAGQYPPYLLFGAVHYLLLADPQEPLADYYPTLRSEPLSPADAFPAFREFCMHHEKEILDLVATRLVQTNEVGRTACLTPAFAHVARLSGDGLLHMIDIGAAAGMNLLFDRYRLDYGRLTWGDPGSRVRIACELKDGAELPLASWQPNVSQRVGVDLNPIDLTSESEARWLRALIRPDRRESAEVLAQAMAVVIENPPTILQGDAVTLLPSLLAEVSTNETACVYQSYALEYFPEDARREFGRILDDFGAGRDLYFVEMAGPGERGRVQLTSWRGGEREEVQLAECASNGQWLRWLV